MTASHIRLLGIVAAAGLGPSAVAGLVQEINLRFDPAVVIPDFDDNGVSIDVPPNAPPQFVITNLVVGFVIEHEWQGDVSVRMEHLGTGLPVLVVAGLLTPPVRRRKHRPAFQIQG